MATNFFTASDCSVDRINGISAEILNAAFQIHSKLGPRLFERVYEKILARDLERLGLQVERQPDVAFKYEGLTFRKGFRPDLIVERAVLVEVKSVLQIAPVHCKQLLTYLRLMEYKLGLLINFGSAHLKDDIRRIVNRL